MITLLCGRVHHDIKAHRQKPKWVADKEETFLNPLAIQSVTSMPAQDSLPAYTIISCKNRDYKTLVEAKEVVVNIRKCIQIYNGTYG
jgi:hypothetical protein